MCIVTTASLAINITRNSLTFSKLLIVDFISENIACESGIKRSLAICTVSLDGSHVVNGDWIDISFFLFASFILFIYLSLCPEEDIHAGRQKYQCWSGLSDTVY